MCIKTPSKRPKRIYFANAAIRLRGVVLVVLPSIMRANTTHCYLPFQEQKGHEFDPKSGVHQHHCWCILGSDVSADSLPDNKHSCKIGLTAHVRHPRSNKYLQRRYFSSSSTFTQVIAHFFRTNSPALTRLICVRSNEFQWFKVNKTH